VTPSGSWAGSQPSTWREYQDIISHVRSQYLATVQAAREQREATTGYAFEEFAAVERSAWHTYHEAGRRAWANYQASQQEQPPPTVTPPQASHPYPLPARGNEYRMPRPEAPPASPYPMGIAPAPVAGLNHGQATFTPYPEGMSVEEFDDRWMPPGTPGKRTEGAPLDQFDERQETYLAANPETRDNQ